MSSETPGSNACRGQVRAVKSSPHPLKRKRVDREHIQTRRVDHDVFTRPLSHQRAKPSLGALCALRRLFAGQTKQACRRQHLIDDPIERLPGGRHTNGSPLSRAKRLATRERNCILRTSEDFASPSPPRGSPPAADRRSPAQSPNAPRARQPIARSPLSLQGTGASCTASPPSSQARPPSPLAFLRMSSARGQNSARGSPGSGRAGSPER